MDQHPTRRITCADCGATVALYSSSRIYHHGPRTNRCPRSGQLAGTIFTASITGAEVTSDLEGVFVWIMAHVWDANMDAIYGELCQLDRRFRSTDYTIYLEQSLTVTRH